MDAFHSMDTGSQRTVVFLDFSKLKKILFFKIFLKVVGVLFIVNSGIFFKTAIAKVCCLEGELINPKSCGIHLNVI